VASALLYSPGTVSHRVAVTVLLLAASAAPARADGDKRCASAEATALYRDGWQALFEHRDGHAIEVLDRCVAADPRCVPCLDTLGWAHWNRSEWDAAIDAWERALKIEPGHGKARDAIATARRAAAAAATTRAPLGTRSEPADAPVTLELTGVIQSYRPATTGARDIYDEDVYSPKSARFALGGRKVYVNSLEGFKTLVFDPTSLRKLAVVSHDFGAAEAPLFHGESTAFDYKILARPPDGEPNHFRGKPVESEISHGGRFLWVPYYRRSWDRHSVSPSAVAIIDTATDKIVRMMPTGPIPKYVVASPDDKVVAVINWGDNTVGLIDTSSGDPDKFAYVAHIVVEKRLPLEGIGDVNRDSVCGFCLRGAVFSADGSTLVIARLGGGGLAGIDVPGRKYLGSVTGLDSAPRHLIVSADGKLYVSHNGPGKVSRIAFDKVVDALRRAGGKRVDLRGWESVDVGAGARTIELSPDGRWLYAAANKVSRVVVVDTRTLKVVSSVRVDSYPVGLAVSPDGKQIWVTSQGRNASHSGNAVSVFRVSFGAR